MGICYTSTRGHPTLIDALYKDKGIQTDLFALCLAEENGLMTIGGFNTTIHKESMITYVPLYTSNHYAINM
jgi:hypothetical protein